MGRDKILKVHIKKIKVSPKFDLKLLQEEHLAFQEPILQI